MALKLKNLAIGRLASGISAAATSITLETGQGALFPTLGAGDWFPLVLEKADASREICRVTARSGDVLTVTRGQESSTALAFSAGDRAELRLTIGALAEFVIGPESAVDNEIPRFDGVTGKLLKAGLKYQTNLTDFTPGVLALVGMGGWGGDAQIVSAAGALDALKDETASRVVRFSTANATSVGAPISQGGVVIHIPYAASNATQIYMPIVSGARMFIRQYSSSAWTAWSEIIKQGDYGLGSSLNALSTNFDTITFNGNYYGTDATGAPSTAVLWGVQHLSGGGAEQEFQTAYRISTYDVRFRFKSTDAAGWQPWASYWHSRGANLIEVDTGSMGYGTGAGGTVTQATSKSTGVTLNKPSGQIVTHNAALAAGATVSFTLSNNKIASTDVVVVNAVANGSYRIEVATVSAGSVTIRITNTTAGSLSQAIGINFAVIKGATA